MNEQSSHHQWLWKLNLEKKILFKFNLYHFFYTTSPGNNFARANERKFYCEKLVDGGGDRGYWQIVERERSTHWFLFF